MNKESWYLSDIMITSQYFKAMVNLRINARERPDTAFTVDRKSHLYLK